MPQSQLALNSTQKTRIHREGEALQGKLLVTKLQEYNNQSSTVHCTFAINCTNLRFTCADYAELYLYQIKLNFIESLIEIFYSLVDLPQRSRVPLEINQTAKLLSSIRSINIVSCNTPFFLFQYFQSFQSRCRK